MVKKKVKKEKGKNKGQVKKWLAMVLVALVLLGGYKYYVFKKQMDERREVFERQRQVMVDHWKEQGLSDEEIEEKLQADRPERMNDSQRPRGMFIMRLFGGGGPRR